MPAQPQVIISWLLPKLHQHQPFPQEIKSLWVASCLLRIMRCHNCAGISAGTYAPAWFSKRRNVPVTLPSNTVCRDAEVHSSRSTQLSRLTSLITGSLGTNAEKTNPGQHMHGTSLYVEAATTVPSLLLRSFVWGGPETWVTGRIRTARTGLCGLVLHEGGAGK